MQIRQRIFNQKWSSFLAHPVWLILSVHVYARDTVKAWCNVDFWHKTNMVSLSPVMKKENHNSDIYLERHYTTRMSA